jgi:hypothetical protein
MYSGIHGEDVVASMLKARNTKTKKQVRAHRVDGGHNMSSVSVVAVPDWHEMRLGRKLRCAMDIDTGYTSREFQGFW